MTTFDPTAAECLVFTFKEGMLSALAHDLKLRVSAFTVELDERIPSVRARFEAASLKVVSAMKNGQENPGALSEEHFREIERTIRHQVLDSERHPHILFRSHSIARAGELVRVAGTLSIRGTERPLVFLASERGGWWSADVELFQPDFGIVPYRAAMGALRLKPSILVRVRLPIPARA